MHSSPHSQVGQQSWDKVKDHGRLELAGVASVHAAQRPLCQMKGPLWVGVAQDCTQQREDHKITLIRYRLRFLLQASLITLLDSLSSTSPD